jgi:hypothetical protein
LAMSESSKRDSISLKFGLVRKLKIFLVGRPGTKVTAWWLGKCEHQVRLSHSMTSNEFKESQRREQRDAETTEGLLTD